jgi:hypothetical protein
MPSLSPIHRFIVTPNTLSHSPSTVDQLIAKSPIPKKYVDGVPCFLSSPPNWLPLPPCPWRRDRHSSNLVIGYSIIPLRPFCFGNFLRWWAFALASTFLNMIHSYGCVGVQGTHSTHTWARAVSYAYGDFPQCSSLPTASPLTFSFLSWAAARVLGKK